MLLNSTRAVNGNPSIKPLFDKPLQSQSQSQSGITTPVDFMQLPSTGRVPADITHSSSNTDLQTTENSENNENNNNNNNSTSSDSSASADSGGSSSGNGNSGVPVLSVFNNNIAREALTELDVKRLAWAVQRVRQIVANMSLAEVSPGLQVVPSSSTESPVRSSAETSSSPLSSSLSPAEAEAEQDEGVSVNLARNAQEAVRRKRKPKQTLDLNILENWVSTFAVLFFSERCFGFVSVHIVLIVDFFMCLIANRCETMFIFSLIGWAAQVWSVGAVLLEILPVEVGVHQRLQISPSIQRANLILGIVV